ncbi:MAG TPA: hypothetical protein VMT28_10685 [Terriglobales bacterium]|jgi:hypothetical protein|nr:hypothetical protein [Terriglobales bacterium]
MSTGTILSFTPEASQSAAATERYQSAYHVAQATADFAETVRLGGIFLGGVCVVAATVAYQMTRAGHLGFPTASLCLTAGAILAVSITRVWEKFFEAQGHLLEMNIDAAVNSSPFLSLAQRAEAISLPRQAANVADIQAKLA